MRPYATRANIGARYGWWLTAAPTAALLAWLAMAERDPGLHVLVLPRNRGKGAAVLAGLDAAAANGFTHALTMDSDGQHPAHLIPAFMTASAADPDAMVLGVPKFDASAPQLRVQGRRVLERLGELRNLMGGHRRFAVRLSRVSGRAAAGGDAEARRGCAASISIPKPWCVYAGAVCVRSTWPHPCAISARTKAAFRISTTGETTCC